MRPKSESSKSAAAAAAETVAVFAHTSLDAHRIALEALTRGDAIARRLPRGYGPLRDQLSRALQSAYLQTGEGAAKSGAERRVRLSSARAEAGEAAAALEAVVARARVAWRSARRHRIAQPSLRHSHRSVQEGRRLSLGWRAARAWARRPAARVPR